VYTKIEMKNIVFLALFFAVSFHVKSQTLQSINHNGVNRVYFYYTPSDYSPSQSLPLLIVLHGLTQTGGGVMDITNFNTIAEQEKFIVVYPSGLNNAWNANMNVSVSTADDKGFLEALIGHFQQNFNTNPSKQYLCGFSNGAFMSHKMACESDLCFAGIATISGTMSDTVYANCNPSKATSVLHIHGTADAVVPYNGGAATGASVDQTIQKWRSFLGCSTNPTTSDFQNTNLFDLSTAQRITYSNCGEQTLEHIKVIGGGHQWPGISTWNGGVGTINMDFYSPQIIWDFLAPKTCQTLGYQEDEIAYEIYPNPAGLEVTIKSFGGIDKVLIQDLTGKKVVEKQLFAELETIGISGLKPGMYLVSVYGLQGKQVGKTKSWIKI
jgi:polyhydroxybutyrate depolymerase